MIMKNHGGNRKWVSEVLFVFLSVIVKNMSLFNLTLLCFSKLLCQNINLSPYQKILAKTWQNYKSTKTKLINYSYKTSI